MRQAMAAYVAALHAAYLDQAAHLPPGERAALPLIGAGSFTVVAVGARHLHVLGTTSALPAISGPEIELSNTDGELSWTLRFYDPVLIPELGLIDESDGPDSAAVRSILGIDDVVYHLSVSPGGGLSQHHAQHAGTALANTHSASSRDYENLRAWAPAKAQLIDEFATAQRVGLTAAANLLAREIAPTADLDSSDAAHLRASLVAALRPGVRL